MFLLVLFLILFYVSHSSLASTAVKEWVARRWGLVRWYRLVYSIISVLLLLLVVWQLTVIPAEPAYQVPFVVQLAGLLGVLAGLALSFLSVMRFGALGFLGLRPEKPGRLVRDGLHGHIRHPIYTGIIMAALGWVLLSPTVPVIISVLVTFIYLPIGIQLEERKLIDRFGEEYIRYRSEVPALVPSGKRAERKKPTS